MLVDSYKSVWGKKHCFKSWYLWCGRSGFIILSIQEHVFYHVGTALIACLFLSSG